MKDQSPGSKRVKARMASKLNVFYSQGKSSEKCKCLTNDISEYGLQLITEVQLDKNRAIFLEIELPYPKFYVVRAIGKIKWYKELPDLASQTSKHVYGVSFDDIDQNSQDHIFLYMYERFKIAAGSQEQKPAS